MKSSSGLSIWFASLLIPATLLGPLGQQAHGQVACNPPAPGGARPWEVSLEVSTYSLANVRNGNVLTAVPVISWPGLGPDVNFALIHNSAHVTSGVNLSHTNGFNLGPGWQTSYSARLIFNSSTSTTVVHDDGRMDTFTKVGGVWISPPGVHDKLEQHTVNPRWTLTHKDQSIHEFNAMGRLAKVRDANGHAIVLTRDSNYKLVKITDAAQQDTGNPGRKLLFDYDGSGRLNKIIDLKAGDTYTYTYCAQTPCVETEAGSEPTGSTLATRTWTLGYDALGRLDSITDPMGFVVEVKIYDPAGRITSIEDKDDDAFTYDYNSDGQLWKVTDPLPSGGGTQYVQQFAYLCPPSPRRTTYTDRRGKAWLYDFDAAGTLMKFTDPLGYDQEYVFDVSRNLTTYKDALDEVWTFTYDSQGNLLDTYTPLMPQSGGTPKMHREYDTLNNLTKVRDAAGNEVQIFYELPSTFPTSPTKITLPLDGQGNPAVDITMTYSMSSTAAGQLATVTDANGVKTYVDYDNWGQLSHYGEGKKPGTWPDDCCVCGWGPSSDSGGRIIFSAPDDGSGSTSSYCYTSLNYMTCAGCIYMIGPGASDQTPPGFPAPPCEVTPPTPAGCWTASYSKMGELLDLSVNVGLSCDNPQYRTQHNEFDKLGRPTLARLSSQEWPASVQRQFTYSPEWADDGSVARTGPDGVMTTVALDHAGRPATLTRGAGSEAITATYTYNSRGLVDHVDYGNGARVEYGYDDDHRVTRIEHKAAGGVLIMKLEYFYNSRDLPTLITESDSLGPYSSITFDYDNRGRLISDWRNVSRGTTPGYDFDYQYDQGGNRLARIDNANNRRTSYTYDISAPTTYGSDNNRLMYSETYDTTVMPWTLLSTTWYSYNTQGNITRMVTESATPGQPVMSTRLVYNHSQQVAYIVGESWYRNNSDCNSYNILYAREFRYDASRARYLNRELDPALFRQNQFVSLSDTWSDYDGDAIYGDFAITGDNPPTITNLRSFEPRLGQKDPWNQASGIKYAHADRLGTLRAQTDSSGATGTLNVFTAFGERVDSGGFARYGYAGAWGYQAQDFPSGNPIVIAHVGARYYDPGSGRFLQRDPLGVFGGINVFSYAEASPTTSVDPLGLTVTGVPGAPGGPFAPPPDYPRGPGGWLDTKGGYKIRPSAPKIPPGGPGLWSRFLLWLTPSFEFTPAVFGWCAVAFAIGYGVGTGIDYAVEAATGESLSDRIGEWMYKACPSCFDWTVDLLPRSRPGDPGRPLQPCTEPEDQELVLPHRISYWLLCNATAWS